ncbi:hypothetical protein M422DRAFT_70152 [Sphaerobolus stellatus SS14]|uniref:Uncharacterized protein n=1 Tax=Sphaerobolus stellatus (strain SS14) TaxID=990650 RepID=A0A0C9UZC5_SPHS4|nr:hypothetical protein M422DRAFT_70152 [Sphaerobolus stellatus SS14]
MAATPVRAPAASSTPRRNLSTGTPQQAVSPTYDDPARVYHEARRAVEQRKRAEQEQRAPASPHAPHPMPNEAPIPYEQLFGNANGNSLGSSNDQAGPSEKELLRRRREEQDAQAPATATPPPPSPQPREQLSEKETMRRAFEARDAAIRAAGQTPPPAVAPAAIPAYRASMNRNASTSSRRPQPTPPPFANVNTNANVNVNGPPGYDAPPLSAWSGGNSSAHERVPTAEEEKAQLAAQYATQDAQNANTRPPSQHGYSPVSVPNRSLAPSPAINELNIPTTLTREKSVRSETSVSEVFLRRDPSISAGKRRASQMGHAFQPPPPPPPLPPRPPMEYIEETREVDRRTKILTDLQVDFSPSFDLELGFDKIGEEADKRS